MWPVLKGEKSAEYDEIILNIDQMRNMFALRKGNWKIISGIYIITYDVLFILTCDAGKNKNLIFDNITLLNYS